MAFQPAPVQKLISKEYAAQRRALISMDKALKEVQPGTPKQLEEGDTIYMTVADADGMMVSLIQSNYRGMGSGMAPPGLGFILQDRGEMFVLQKNHPNGYAPGKRPFQTIIPAFITKGDRKSTRLNSSHSQISYAVFCLKKKKKETIIPSMLMPPISDLEIT